MNKNITFWILVLIVLVAVTFWLNKTPNEPGRLDVFASCLAQSGAKFYGAFWCPHCANQKALFGSSAKLLPYVECSTPDGRSRLQVCTDAGVTGYPTWDFITGTTTMRESGEVSLERLSELSNCPLPAEPSLPTGNDQ